MTSLFAILLCSCLAGESAIVAVRAASQEATDNDDRAVISAILEHSIRPYVQRANGNVTPVPPLFVYSRTMPFCPGPPAPAQPCVQFNEVQVIRKSGGKIFDVVIPSDLIRRELVDPLTRRNQESQSLPRLTVKDVVIVSPADAVDFGPTQYSPARGVSYFTQPVYSHDFALVDGEYVCGFLCAHNSLYLLRRTPAGWEVAAEELLWFT